MKIEKWQTEGKSLVADCRIFKIHEQKNRSPRTDKVGNFFVLESADWVNVVPVTANDEVVLIEQYRHGTDSITWEIPGGCVDAEDTSPLESAKRELREETGYTATEWEDLGWVHPNPAILNNRCHFFLAKGVTVAGETQLDPFEEIGVKVIPLKELWQWMDSGKITHALARCALSNFRLRQR